MRDRATATRYLTGALTGGDRPDAVGRKFTPDGAPLTCPGHTTLCHVAEGSEAFAALVAAQEQLRSGPHADAFTFMPPQSFHMTIFEGVIDYARRADRWPRHLPLDASIDAVIEDAQKRLTGLGLPKEIVVRPMGIFAGFSVSMSGADDAAETLLRETRNTLRDASNILRPDHASYEFHITLGYPLRWLSQEEAIAVADASADIGQTLRQQMPRLTLGPVELCRFDTMHHFEVKALI